MKRFVQGDNRTQSFLLAEALDDYVTDTNPVRVVDVFVDELDLQKLGFDGVEPALTGRPSYHPEVVLRIYIYGYLNQGTGNPDPRRAGCSGSRRRYARPATLNA